MTTIAWKPSRLLVSIAGFVGDARRRWFKTPCCEQWICCDTAFVSLRGGGYCQVEHERFSLCYSHYQDQHGGPWKVARNVAIFWSPKIINSMREPNHQPRY